MRKFETKFNYSLVQRELKEKMTEVSFNSWIKTTEFKRFEGDTLILCPQSAFHKDIIMRRYDKMFKETLFEIYGVELNLEYILAYEDMEEDYEDSDYQVLQMYMETENLWVIKGILKNIYMKSIDKVVSFRKYMDFLLECSELDVDEKFTYLDEAEWLMDDYFESMKLEKDLIDELLHLRNRIKGLRLYEGVF